MKDKENRFERLNDDQKLQFESCDKIQFDLHPIELILEEDDKLSFNQKFIKDFDKSIINFIKGSDRHGVKQ